MNELLTMMMAQASEGSAPADGTAGPPPAGQETGTQAPGGQEPGPEGAPPQKQTIWDFLPLLVGMGLILYFFMIRPNKKRQEQQQKMMSSMAKGTRVRTIGGILGTVVDVRGDEVVLKIDESTNAKVRMMRQAVAQVFGEESEDEAKSS